MNIQINHARENIAPSQNEGKTNVLIEVEVVSSSQYTCLSIYTVDVIESHQNHVWQHTSATIEQKHACTCKSCTKNARGKVAPMHGERLHHAQINQKINKY